MPTFLELVNDLERESGTIQQNARLVSTVNAPNRQEKMVEWVRDAWVLIQNARTDWLWMRSEFQTDIIAGQPRAGANALSISDFSHWLAAAGEDQFTLYDPAIGRADEAPLYRTDWSAFKRRWDRGLHTPNRPTDVAVAPDGRLCFGPTPDKAYTLRGEYYRAPQVLTKDTDVPLCSAQHHSIIVWRALMLLGDHDEAQPVIATAAAKYQSAFRNLVDDSVGEVSL